MIKTITLLITLFGVVTYYPSSQYSGKPLYCDRDGTLLYDESLEWIALPLGGDWICGDMILVVMDDTRLILPVLDTGPFGDNCVKQLDGACLAIRGDLPEHLFAPDGLSAASSILNISLLNRQMGGIAMVDYIR